jgi:hypothetical protein
MASTLSVTRSKFTDKADTWVDLALTLPIFLAYHIGVVFLPVRNGTDFVTNRVLAIAHGNRLEYIGITALVGLIFAGAFAFLAKGQQFHRGKFVQIALEGTVYALLLQTVSSYVVGRIFFGPRALENAGPFEGFVMSMGAGFYEEIAFRVVLFGVGSAVVLRLLLGPRGRGPRRLGFAGVLITLVWAVACACIFSGVHYVGQLGDSFELPSFVFRVMCGLVLTLVFVTRGFAAAVWTHALYDFWVIVLH